MTDEELAAIEARANAATPGPWRDEGPDERRPRYPHDAIVGPAEDCGIPAMIAKARGFYHSAEVETANSQFIAHAREDVPALVAEVRRLRAELHMATKAALR